MRKVIIPLLAALTLVSTTAFASSLSDINGSKNKTAIQYLFDEEIISGYPDGTFKPDNTVNRAELLKILVGGKGITPTVEEYKDCFPDVKEEWFAPYVCYAKNQEWVSGYPDGSFKPAQEVNKVEALKMLVNSQGYQVASTINAYLFDDADSNAWYAPYLAIAKEKGLLESTNGTYGTGESMSRQEISENIYRAIIVKRDGLTEYIEDEDEQENEQESEEVEDNEESDDTYLVTKVIDGDTIEVDSGIKVRLIGVDTPETVHPTQPVECFGQEASNATKSQLLNQEVTLQADPSQDNKDKYDRLLRYVILSDGTNFNQWLIENGYAYEYTYNTPYELQSQFKAAQTSAENNRTGLWDTNTCPVTEEESDEEDSNYICSSNFYNCGDFNSHSEAQSVFDYCMSEVGSDIHKLDGDNNGLACESL